MATKEVEVDGKKYFFDDEKPYVKSGNGKIYKAIPNSSDNPELESVLIGRGVETDDERSAELKQTLQNFLESTKPIKR